MNQSTLFSDDDQESLFGSPPPSPARGRSPSQETAVIGGETGPIDAVPSAEVGRKNVGTIALPGSHMSCAELPADLPASSLSVLCLSSSRDSSSIPPPNITGTFTSVHTSAVTSRSSTRSVRSRASSAASTTPASASTRKRRTPKSKSMTPTSPAPPIALPGPNEPTPPNFLRSQSSLLGLAGLVGCVKPAQLYAHPQPNPRPQSPIRGSTPAHPIVLDDNQENPHIGKRPRSQPQTPQTLDQLDPEVLRSNITNSLTKEKYILPVLESLIKLLGGEPHLPANPPPRPFARPYGYGIFNVQPSPPMALVTSSDDSTTASAIPPPKRRKLKHVPAGAIDWDIPFPFAPGEGPEAYHDTWARNRAKQLVTQLLELVKNAAQKAATKTAKNGKGRARVQSSRSASAEAQTGQICSTQRSTSLCTGKEANVYESPSNAIMNEQVAVTGTPVDCLGHYLGRLETPCTIGSPASGSKDRMSVNSEGALEGGSLVAPCDYSAFEEWLSQLQQFVPLGHHAPTPESDWCSRTSESLNSSASTPAPDVQVPTMGDEAIDPVLLALSQQSGSVPSTSTVTLGDIPQAPDISLTPPVLAHSPRTSLSSLTEPLTPLSEVFVDVLSSTMVHQDPVGDLTHQLVEKDHPSRPADGVGIMVSSRSLPEPSEPPRITAAQKGKARATSSRASAPPSASSRSTPSAVSTSKDTLDKQAILKRARERRSQLVAEIERAKVELWETTLENAVLIRFMRDGSL